MIAFAGNGLGHSCDGLLLLRAQLRRYLQRHLHVKIALLAAPYALDPLALQSEHGPRLSSRRNFIRYLLFQRRHDDIVSQSRLIEGYRYLQPQILSASFEKLVRLDVYHDVEIAVRSAVYPGFALTLYRDHGVVVYAGRNVDRYRHVILYPAAAAAVGIIIFSKKEGKENVSKD